MPGQKSGMAPSNHSQGIIIIIFKVQNCPNVIWNPGIEVVKLASAGIIVSVVPGMAPYRLGAG